MKPIIGAFSLTFISLLLCMSGQAQTQSGQDSTGLPGDNFSLQGALEMFKKASSPEEFEKLLNAPDNHVNNLDLNGDGNTDYIRVVDNSNDNAHAFALQDVVSEKESQDIAVIELEKSGDQDASLQIVGDEDIYGEQVIVEPSDDGNSSFNNPSIGHDLVLRGPNAYFPQGLSVNDDVNGIVVNVWLWPCVRFVYTPSYVVWRSPWRWNYYPGWWRPWRPFGWYAWHPFHYGYERHFAVVTEHRMLVARRIYTPVRVTSITVRTRNVAVVNHYRATRTTARHSTRETHFNSSDRNSRNNHYRNSRDNNNHNSRRRDNNSRGRKHHH